MELTIDTADGAIGLCLSESGVPRVEWVQRLNRTHSAELLPMIEALFRRAAIERTAIALLAVCLGPGGYTGLRVGVSAAKGLALGLGARIVGIERFAAEAWPLRAYPGPVVTVHSAGRGEYAWQLFRGGAAAGAAAIGPAARLVASAPDRTLFAGEIDEELALLLTGRASLLGAAATRRPAVVAELAWRRLQSGDTDELATLGPIYLREPVIGPARKTGAQRA